MLLIRCRGKIHEADTLAEKISVIICNNQSEQLSNLASQFTRKLCAAVNLNIEDRTLISLSTFQLIV